MMSGAGGGRLLRESSSLPLLVSPPAAGTRLATLLPALRDQLEPALLEHGGILFRGFEIGGAQGLREFAGGCGNPLLPYDFASTPRSLISDGVYTSTEYPAHQHIPLHNEHSYTREWPMRIWFHCLVPAEQGGQTPIADSRCIFERISPKIRDEFQARQLLYVRNYGNGLDLPWQRVFRSESRTEVEAYCRPRGIVCEWKSDGSLRTRQVAQAIAQHPRTLQSVWFNQAHLFHVSSLDAPTRQALLEAVDREDLPRNVYYGDGGEIEPEALEEIRVAFSASSVHFDWQQDDVLMLDNMLTAHGRTPFKGQRKVLVAMA